MSGLSGTTKRLPEKNDMPVIVPLAIIGVGAFAYMVWKTKKKS